MAWKRFWDRLLRRRAPQRQEPSGEDLIAPLRKIAQDQGRSLDDVTYDLLAHSLAQRNPSPASERLWTALTPREQDVTALVYAGYSNPEVADLLDLSVETVRSHIQHTLRKSDLHSKAELCLALQHEGSDGRIQRRLEKLLNRPRSPDARG